MCRQTFPHKDRISSILLFVLIGGFLPSASSQPAAAEETTPAPVRIVVTRWRIAGSRIMYEIQNQGATAADNIRVYFEATVNGQKVSTRWRAPDMMNLANFVLPPGKKVVSSAVFWDSAGKSVAAPADAKIHWEVRARATGRAYPPLDYRVMKAELNLYQGYLWPRIEIRNLGNEAVEDVDLFWAVYDRESGQLLIAEDDDVILPERRLGPGQSVRADAVLNLPCPFRRVPRDQRSAMAARLGWRAYVFGEYVKGGFGARLEHPAIQAGARVSKVTLDLTEVVGGARLHRVQLSESEEDRTYYVESVLGDRYVVPPGTYTAAVTLKWEDPATGQEKQAQETRRVTVKPGELTVVTFFGQATTPTPTPEARCTSEQVEKLRGQVVAWDNVRWNLRLQEREIAQLIAALDDVQLRWAPVLAQVNRPDVADRLRALLEDVEKARGISDVLAEVERRTRGYLSSLPDPSKPDISKPDGIEINWVREYFHEADEALSELEQLASKPLPVVTFTLEGLKQFDNSLYGERREAVERLAELADLNAKTIKKLPPPPKPVNTPVWVPTNAEPTVALSGEGARNVTPAGWVEQELGDYLGSAGDRSGIPFIFRDNAVGVRQPVSEDVRTWLKEVLLPTLGKASGPGAYPELEGEDRKRMQALARDLQAAVTTWDLVTEYNSILLDASPTAYAPLVQRAPRVSQVLKRLRQRYGDLQELLAVARRVADKQYMAAFKPFAECVTNATDKDIKDAVQQIAGKYTQQADELDRELNALDDELDKWWTDLADTYGKTAIKAADYGRLALDLYSKAYGETPLMEGLVLSARSVEELLGLLELAKLAGKGVGELGKLGRQGVQRLLRLQEAADLARARAGVPEAARNTVRDVLKEMADNKRLFGSEAATEKKLLKWYKTLKDMGLNDEQIRQVLKAPADPEEAKRVLALIRESIQDTARELGPFDFKAVGTGAEVDKVVAGVGELPDPSAWNFIRNDYDVSVFLPPERVKDILQSKMTKAELNRYLQDLGLPPDLDVNAIPADLQAHIARQKVLDTITQKFTARNGGIPPLAYDNMWFHGFATRGTRQEYLIDAMDVLRGQPQGVKDQLRQAFGEDPARAIRRMLRQGRGEEAISKLQNLEFADRDRLIVFLAQASRAPDMKDVLAGRVPVWRVTNVLEDDAFLTRGGKKLVEIMAEGAPSPAFRASGNGIARTPETATYLRPDFAFTPGDGVDILTEMGAFLHFYKRKGPEKVAKYYLRGAFGRLATDPELAPILKREYLKLATYRGAALPPEARMVILAETLGRERGLFKPEEIERLKQALFLKYPKNEALRKIFPNVEKPLVNRTLDAMADDLSAWRSQAQREYSQLVGRGHVTQAADEMHRLGQRATLGRLDAETLRQWFGLNPQEAARVSRIKYHNPTLAATPGGRLQHLLMAQGAHRGAGNLLNGREGDNLLASMLPATAQVSEILRGVTPEDPTAVSAAEAARLSPAQLEQLGLAAARRAGVAGTRSFGEEALAALDEILTPRGNLAGYYASLGAESPLSRLGAFFMDLGLNPLSFLPRLAKSLYEGFTKDEQELWGFMYQEVVIKTDLDALLTGEPEMVLSRLDAIDLRLRQARERALALDYDARVLMAKIDARLALLRRRSEHTPDRRARMAFLQQARQEVASLLEQRVRPQKARFLERVGELERRMRRAHQAAAHVRTSEQTAARFRDALDKISNQVRLRLKYADYGGLAEYTPAHVRVTALLRAWALNRQVTVMRASDVEALHKRVKSLMRMF